MRRLPLALAVLFSACPAPSGTDSGMVVDSGPPPPSCDSPEDCKVAGYDGVCRGDTCAAHVPCSDDLECGLGEQCLTRECVFTGCVADADCPTGRCRTQSFSCAECGENSDCPFDRPICQTGTQKCVQCSDDSECAPPGPSHCEAIAGKCAHCLLDAHCPNGLTCNGGVCAGVQKGQACPMGTQCDLGLVCVSLGGNNVCLESCNAYVPGCPIGQVCYLLKYTDDRYIFNPELLGVCFDAAMGARNYRDTCTIDNTGLSNCQPSLQCVPDGLNTSACRTYCDPGAIGACPSPETCHHFPGDTEGRQYGLCYADNGYGDRCLADTQCRTGMSCRPGPDLSSFDDYPLVGQTPWCQFAVGTSPGLAPCSNVRRADGGITLADATCASGACRSDNAIPPYFCFAACEKDTDCSISTRSGTCDATYSFINVDGAESFITGCRPGCLSSQTCDAYDGGLICRPRLITSTVNSGLKLNCAAPVLGVGGAGASCSSNAHCTSGYCSTSDARGVGRMGYCLEPCQNAGECAASVDAGLTSGPLDCLPTTYLGYRGLDFMPGTRDDVLSVKRVCSGIACNKDEDCSPDGGIACAPDVSPLDAGAYVLRCRPQTNGGLRKTAGQVCTAETDCLSGACGLLGDNSKVCFQSCDVVGASPCPSGLTCRAGAFRFTATAGNTLTVDGCAP